MKYMLIKKKYKINNKKIVNFQIVNKVKQFKSNENYINTIVNVKSIIIDNLKEVIRISF